MALTFNQVKPTTVSQEQVPAPKNETGMANVTIPIEYPIVESGGN